VTPGQRLRAAYAQAVLERGMVDDPEQQAALARLAALADALEAQRSPRGLLARLGLAPAKPTAPRGLYLWGGVGRGKTWLMDLFHRVALHGEGQRSHFNHFMRDAHAALRELRGGPRPLQRLARQIGERTRLLCLDELSVGDIGDAMILHGLFSGLLEAGVTLVITSNQPPSGLYPGGLQRERFLPAIALLEQALERVHLDGGVDYRLRRLEQAGNWLVGDEPANAARLQALFDDLRPDGSAVQGATSLDLEGRSVAVRACTDGLAWFDFTALCEGPRGTADYIGLADRFHTVLLSGVPVFDASRDDAARRFISLVDEFYDRGTRLVASAAAEPQALYRGERLAFAFARTTSRLIEMRGRAYLERRR
jgi:cell division protein ZapE